MCSALRDDVMKSYLCGTRKFEMAVLNWKQRLLCDKKCFNPLPDDKILDWFRLKKIADYILKCI